MKFITNECIEKPVYEFLGTKGLDLISVIDLGLSGELDPQVFERASASDRIVITYDKSGFRPNRLNSNTGVILLREYPSAFKERADFIQFIIQKLGEDRLYGYINVVEHKRIRCRDIQGNNSIIPFI